MHLAIFLFYLWMMVKDWLAQTLERMWYQPTSVRLVWRIFSSIVLIPLSWLFRWGLIIRWRWYSQPFSFNVPILVIGNITAGGSGKTPFTIALAQALHERGHRIGIIAHGYGVKTPTPHLADPHELSMLADETRLYLRHCPFATVIEGRPRHRSIAKLIEHDPQCSLILVDDGLQDPRFARTVEIVLIHEQALGNRRILPAGALREPWKGFSALEKPSRVAKHRIVVHSQNAPSSQPSFCFHPLIHGFVDWADFLAHRPRLIDRQSLLPQTPRLLITAIARPFRVMESLAKLAIHPHHHPLADHAMIDRKTIATLLSRYAQPNDFSQWEIFVTEKDAVKLALDPTMTDCPWRTLVIQYRAQLPIRFIETLEQLI